MPEFYPAAVISAAATVQGLEGLVFDAGHLRPPATLDLLLPLTAAAGGPGSTLKKLELKMRFTADATSAVRSPQAKSDMPLAPLGQAATSALEARENHDKTSALLAAPNAIESNTCAGSAADVTPAVCRTGGAKFMHAQPSAAGHGSSDKSQLLNAGDQCPGGETSGNAQATGSESRVAQFTEKLGGPTRACSTTRLQWPDERLGSSSDILDSEPEGLQGQRTEHLGSSSCCRGLCKQPAPDNNKHRSTTAPVIAVWLSSQQSCHPGKPADAATFSLSVQMARR